MEIVLVQIGLALALEIIDPQVAAAVSTAGERLLSSPIIGVAGSCACAASGHAAAAAPPSSVMKSRRLRSSMRRPYATASATSVSPIEAAFALANPTPL